MKWDERFLGLACFIAGWSKDQSTKVGAVVTDGRRIVSVGFNGLPQGVEDSPERYEDRETKYSIILHAERNALLFAQRPLKGCTCYTWPMPPCAACAAMLIQSGISRVVCPPVPGEKKERWGKDVALAERMYEEAGVQLVYVGVCDVDGI